MFDFIDRYIEQAKPVANQIAGTAEAYANRIIQRLDDIVEALESEEYTEERRDYRLSLTADVEQDVVQVPVGQSWELEQLSALGTAAVTVNEAGRFKYVTQFNSADTQNPGTIFRGGEAITIVASGNVTPLSVYIQFKVQRRKAAKPTRSAGDIVQPTDQRNFDEVDNMGRHFARDIAQGVNPIGERSVDVA